jgi:Ala-tRNA(Pro) deacylase
MADGGSECKPVVAAPAFRGAERRNGLAAPVSDFYQSRDGRPRRRERWSGSLVAKTRGDLFAFLDGLGIGTETVEHPPLHTVEEGRALRGAIAGGHTKNLLLKDKKGRLFLVVAEEDRAIDLKTLHARIGAQGRLSFVDAERMLEALGVAPGAVTAFGLLNDAAAQRVTLVLDAGLLAHDMVNCHPLLNTATTTIRRDDLLRFFEATGHRPTILDFGAGAEREDGARERPQGDGRE